MSFDHLQGWTPNPRGVEAFLKTLDKPLFGDAASHLLTTEKKDTVLYKALARLARKDYFGSAQGIGDCHIAGQKVTMADGTFKNIEDVKVGEIVISHTNTPRKVINTIKKLYTGNIIKIRAKGYNEWIHSTPDHEFIAYPNLQYGRRTRNTRANDKKSEWVPIQDIKIGTRILLSSGLDNKNISNEVIDITKYVDCDLITESTCATKNSGNEINRFVTIDDSFGWLIGMYLAEGGCSCSTIQFSLSIDEQLYAQQLQSLLYNYFGIEATITPNNHNGLVVKAYSKTLELFLKHFIPGDLYNKTVPEFIFRANRSVRLSCLRGWTDGDGQFKYNKANSPKLVGVSAAHSLINHMYRLANSCGLRTNTIFRKKEKHQRVASQELQFYTNSALDIYPDRNNVTRTFTRKNADVVEYGLAKPIAEKEEYYIENEYVYCLEVEIDHSFIVNGYSQSNCVSWGWGHGVDTILGIMYDLGLTGEWREAATEAIYGGSRVEARGVKYGGWGDGSYGAAAAKYVNKWGILYRQKYDNDDLTQYSSNRAKQWGNYGVPDYLEPLAKDHPVKQVTLVTTFDEAAAAIQNGYPVPVCSGQGFSSSRDKDGFARASGSWSHCGVAGTKISTINGNKNIEDITDEDYVLTHNNRLRKVSAINQREYSGNLYTFVGDGYSVTFTSEHPFWIKTQEGCEWKKAEDVTKEMKLVTITFDGYQYLSIRDIIVGHKLVDVYNMEVEEDNSYLANGIIVHNCMLFYGVRYGSRPGLLCQNSWGVFNSGPKWPDDQPDGSFWVEASVADRMLRGEDSFAISDAVGFPKRKINWGDVWN